MSKPKTFDEALDESFRLIIRSKLRRARARLRLHNIRMKKWKQALNG
jgi:hypothetical protein